MSGSDLVTIAPKKLFFTSPVVHGWVHGLDSQQPDLSGLQGLKLRKRTLKRPEFFRLPFPAVNGWAIRKSVCYL